MVLDAIREEIVAYGHKLAANALTVGTGGNLSQIDRRQNLVAITPSAIDYARLQPQDVVLMNLDGETVEAPHPPSSEWHFHLGLYRQRSDIGAVVHTHSVYATTLACLHWELPAIHYLVGLAGTKVPLSPYATFGTQALADQVCASIGQANAVLMANHGLVSTGSDLASAFRVAEHVEFTARVYYQARCAGQPQLLDEQQMHAAMKRFETYGQNTAFDDGPNA